MLKVTTTQHMIFTDRMQIVQDIHDPHQPDANHKRHMHIFTEKLQISK
jgi:hypothetical protein